MSCDGDYDDDDYCYECMGYGDDYFEDDDGNVISRCHHCPYGDSEYYEGWDE